MVYEDVDSALLRLFECFMEAAPQLTLQLYIMQTNFQHGTTIFGWICVPVMGAMGAMVVMCTTVYVYRPVYTVM